jgi:predicted Zn-dependent protease
MTSKPLLMCLVCAALLSACAGRKALPPPVQPEAPTMAALLEQADTAVKAQQFDTGMSLLKRAAALEPDSKLPWLRIAQLSFRARAYGDAITYAQQAIARDPDDMVAHSIAAVSGLRVSSKALADLTRRNKIDSDVRSEARSLATILRTSIGGDIIVPESASVQAGSLAPGGNPARGAQSNQAD